MNQEDSYIFNRQPLTEEESFLIHEYEHLGKSLDNLPYSEEFEQLAKEYHSKFGRDISNETRRELLHKLLQLRKSGRLPRLNKFTQQKIEF